MSDKKALTQIKVLNLLVIAIVIGWITYSHFSQSKIAFVDSTVLLEKYEGMKSARAAFQNKSRLWQANIDTLTAEFKSAVDDFEKEKTALTKKESELSQKLILSKRKQLTDYQQAIQQQSQQEDFQMTQKVLAEVNTLITAYAEKNGYDMILGATGGGNVVYAKDHLDITDAVVIMLNDQYAGL